MAISYIQGGLFLHPHSSRGRAPARLWKLQNELENTGWRGLCLVFVILVLFFSLKLWTHRKCPHGCVVAEGFLGFAARRFEEEGTGIRGSSDWNWSLGVFWYDFGVGHVSSLPVRPRKGSRIQGGMLSPARTRSPRPERPRSIGMLWV